ncbi:unnamed protein product [Moneuplotes crassus]|uniref:Uncharacterized protein n=1 Tax=Euplotes crassus TaxID=5936 RepID=A0AAD2D3Q4_EUPCR|nr:unnamed protein product [Moneuplotes crassus]
MERTKAGQSGGIDIFIPKLNRLSKIARPKSEVKKSMLHKGAVTKSKEAKLKKYFKITRDINPDCPLVPGIYSLYALAKLAKKQVVKAMMPPTVLLGFNHDNMFIYTSAATKCLTVENRPMTPKLLTHYVKTYMDRKNDEESKGLNNSIKMSVYPKFVLKYSTYDNSFPSTQSIMVFYKIQDLCTHALEYWGKFDMAIQPYIICKSRKASLLRYEVYKENMVKAHVLSSDYDISELPYLPKDEILNVRNDYIYQRRGNSENERERSDIPLSQAPNSDLINYFCITTQSNIPKVAITSCRPLAYPNAESMSTRLVNSLNSNYLHKKFRANSWIIGKLYANL